MGKPRMIILIRHAQSEGNKNRDIHQFIPDHRVKLTQHGWTQAEEAGRQLRSLLRPDDTLQFYTSPYRRTRETTEGILRTLTSDDPTPSPFPRNKITVFEEPRLREQDFGNFQPCSAEMERMWQERADYGHFFYRIPDGESAADAYDRVSGFNESLWRQFGDEDFPSVCVLVTHGLMSRVFLMKWYHWSVEYFEDLRNVNHCEFIVMKQSDANKKFVLQNELRTWSELKRRAAAAGGGEPKSTTPSRTHSHSALAAAAASPVIPVRRWGGCVNGCDHDKVNWPTRPMRRSTMEYLGQPSLSEPVTTASPPMEEQEDVAAAAAAAAPPAIEEPAPSKLGRKHTAKLPMTPASPNDASNDATSDEEPRNPAVPRASAVLRHLQPPHRAPGEGASDDSDYFPGMQRLGPAVGGKGKLRASSRQRQASKERKLARKQTEQSWKAESGMGSGRRADTLGDGDEDPSGNAQAQSADAGDGDGDGDGEPILREALKGDMQVEHHAAEPAQAEDKMAPSDVERLEEKEGTVREQVY
ncbi:phosphoglycerate mutase-like protein [Didymella exigua CBS 183.55]|uniref:Phosphoglycerate mutase-like protein n=1 Tax=Didymella exigua CBS 183.55 TaxID=1150837 RepID=A0A6A5RVR8_9PLEO|nr:phosphoglycerate mutase-like protein [Didymella exigua CBS 183.55]KAF1931254.1 phosphoglycerate mutase-like protein [Didymella exigua CBS 183.55]